MKGISAYILSPESRSALEAQFPPQFSKFVGHHVTYQFGASDKDPLPPAGQYHVVGYVDITEPNYGEIGDGLEAFVISIKLPHQSRGHTERPDGGTFHITWSHGPSYSPKDSIELVSKGFQEINPIEIELEPVFLPFN